MKTFGKIMGIVIAAIVITAIGVSLEFLAVSGIYWIICALLGWTFCWKYAIVATIILLAISSFFRGILKSGKKD